MIAVEKLVKHYGRTEVLRGVTFHVGAGELVGFLGPNGAGKSTTLRILAGYLGMTSGSVRVAGHDIVQASYEARKAMGYMPEAVPLYPEMRVGEYLSFRAELKGVPRSRRVSWVADALEKAHLRDVQTAPIGTLSKGYRQRVGLADALVSRPPLLLLDEPTAGLDPNQVREVRDVLRSLGRDHTVFLSTHILSEVEAVCSRIVLLHRGEVVAQGTLDEIRRLRAPSGVRVEFRGNGEQALALAQSLLDDGKVVLRRSREGKEEPMVLECAWSSPAEEGAMGGRVEALVSRLVAAGMGVREVVLDRGSLETVFASVTASEPMEASKRKPSSEGA